MECKNKIFNLLDEVREKNPLVLHYTNEVTINDCANITLALGASPLMSYSNEEVEELIKIAGAVVINIGTMNSSRLELFLKAGKLANKYNKPVILDPVGVFATKTRTDFVQMLLNEIKFTVIKGNLAEIKYIAGFDVKGQGVDSKDNEEILDDTLKGIANKLKATIVATGKIDHISDGYEVIKIFNGTEKLKSVTGTGCMTGSLIGSYLAISEEIVYAAAMGVLTMSLCGELADRKDCSIGTFKVNIMDEIYKLNRKTLEKWGKID